MDIVEVDKKLAKFLKAFIKMDANQRLLVIKILTVTHGLYLINELPDITKKKGDN